MKTLSPKILLVGALGLVIAISGCATKKFVRTTVTPVETKVNEVDQRTTQNTEKIGALDEEVSREVSRLDEQLSTALEDARTADGKAVAAQSTADRAVARAGDVETAANAGFTRVDMTLADSTGQISVLTGDGLPAVGARLKVRGEVLVGITVGATRYGTSLQEAGRDYLH